MTYRIEINAAARKGIRSLSDAEYRRVMERIQALAAAPRPSGCVKLAGMENTFRIRAGVHRVIYEIHDGLLLVMVIRVAHRREAYRR